MKMAAFGKRVPLAALPLLKNAKQCLLSKFSSLLKPVSIEQQRSWWPLPRAPSQLLSIVALSSLEANMLLNKVGTRIILN